MEKILTLSEEEHRNPSLHASIRDGVSHAFMLGSGENYLGVFGIFLHATTLQVGLLSTLPQFFGAVMQWAGAASMERLRSRRKAILSGAIVQAVSLLLIAILSLIPLRPADAVTLLLGLMVIYHGANGVAVPIWNSLMGDLVPSGIRGRFFGSRNRLTGMSTFGALLLAGATLHILKLADRAAFGFMIIFTAAFVARVNSARWLAKHEDPEFAISPEQAFTLGQFLRRSPRSNFARFVFFFAAINFGVAFSSPYFALYMLRDLHFSYIEFTIVTGMATVSQFLTFRYWGELTDPFGSKKILNLCGWGVAIVPMLWLVSSQIVYLLIIQIFSGLVWSGFNLASANFMFDAVSPPKRARCVAYQGLVNGFFVLAGSLAGGVAAGHLPEGFQLGPWTWTPPFMLPVIFLLSGLLRLLAAVIFLPRFNEVRPVEPIRHREILFRVSQIRPIAGATFSIFTGLFREPGTGMSRDTEND
jgi:MFS family permease